MVQNFRPALSYAATTSAVIVNAAPDATNMRDLHRRITDKYGVVKGTTQYGTLKTTGGVSSTLTMQIPDAVYSTLVNSPYNMVVNDAQYNSSVAEAFTYAIASGGTGHSVGDVLTVVGGTGTPAKVQVTTVSAGVVTGVTQTQAPVYTVLPANPVSTTSTGAGTGCTLNLTAQYGNTSFIPTSPNPGFHRQICLAIGDSLTEGPTGATTYPELNVLKNQLAFFGVESAGIPVTYIAAEGSPYQAPDRAQTINPFHNKSRIVFQFGHGGWRCTNITTGNGGTNYTYTQGSPWVDNIAKLTNIAVHSDQQIVAYIFLGTNDMYYATQNGNGGLFAVPTGTPGYTHTGNPNYIQHSLTPLIAALKNAYPNIKIIWQSSIGRGSQSASFDTLNARFLEIGAYVKANKVALGVDVMVDSNAIPEFAPSNYAVVTANSTYYQSDNTHLTPAGYARLGSIRGGVYDYVLGFPLSPSLTGIVF